MNTYFGNAYVCKIFFLGVKICHAIMSCKTYEMTLFFYDLRFVISWVCNVETNFK